MVKPFKFRYVNELAGIFVLLVFLLFVAGIVLAGRAQGWFEHYRHVSITFPASGSSGLKKGADVEMLGATAGSVDRMSMDDEGNMHAILSIRSDFFPFVRRDSRVILKKQFVVVGDAYVEITRGKDKEPLPEGYTFSCEVGGELIDSIQALLKEAREKKVIEGIREDSLQVRDALLDVLGQVRKFLDEYTALAVHLNDPQADLRRLLSRIDRIAARLEAGRGTAGRLLADDVPLEKVLSLVDKAGGTLTEAQALIKNLKKTAGEIPDLSKAGETLDLLLSILEDLKKTTALLPRMAGFVNGELEDAPGTMVQVRADLKDAEELLEALKRHWLIRGYVREPGAPAPIPPAAVYSPEDEGNGESRGGGREGRRRSVKGEGGGS